MEQQNRRSKGGHTRVANLSAEERSASARKPRLLDGQKRTKRRVSTNHSTLQCYVLDIELNQKD